MTRVLHLICLVGALVSTISADAQLFENAFEGIGKLLLAPPSSAPKVVANETEQVQAKCIFERKHEFRAPPRLFFYTRKQHAANTLGCSGKKAKKITLRNRNGHYHMEPKLDIDNIKRRLIDTDLFNPELSTYFIVHGYQSSWNSSDWMCNLKDILLNSTDANVFIVDWSGGSKPQLAIDYGMAVGNTQIVGLLLGEFIDRLVELSGQPDASSYHLIGHSLGAHVSGFAGYHVQSLGKITALDPAGPCFRTSDEEEARRARDTGYMKHGRRRLSRQSAKLVVAVHTDSALFGLPEECAHYDVFVNGGRQPFCKIPSIGDAIGGAIGSLFVPKTKPTRVLGPSCPHSFAYKLLSGFVRFFKRVGDRLKGKKSEKALDRAQLEGSLVMRDDQEEISKAQQDDGKSNQCHMIGYQCANYEAFERGECGFCKDGDLSCVLIGLTFDGEGNELNPVTLDRAADSGGADVADDNDYDDEQTPDRKGASRGGELEGQKAPVGSTGEMFIKTGDEGDVCLFHYQVLVALDSERLKSVSEERAQPVALQLQLDDKSAKLLELKHRLEARAAAFKRLQGDFIDTLWEADVKVALESRDNLTFDTTLITFKVAPSEKCAKAKSVAVGDRLCKPFERLEGARLWSTDAKKLEAVRWAAVNYMSGFDARARASRSFALEPPAGGLKVTKRKAVRRRFGKSADGPNSKMKFQLELVPTRLDRTVWSSGVVETADDESDASNDNVI